MWVKKKKVPSISNSQSHQIFISLTLSLTCTYTYLLTHTLSHTAYREDTHHIHQIPKLARDTAHAVIYVFDATDPAAVRRADRQWVLEQRFPGVPLLFVGNKKDGGRGYKVSFLPFRFFVVCVRVCGRICVGEKKKNGSKLLLNLHFFFFFFNSTQMGAWSATLRISGTIRYRCTRAARSRGGHARRAT